MAGALLGGSLLAAAPTATAASYDTLTPGVGISGRLTIGMTRSAVVTSLGASQCAGVSSCFIGNAGSGGSVQVHFYAGVVEALEFENQAGYFTAEGVTPKSSLAQVASIYGVGVSNKVAAVVNKGYAAKEITDYLCSDTGCSVAGSHLRHYIFKAGDATRTEHTSDKSIVVRNPTRQWGFIKTNVVVRGPGGQVVVSESISPYLPPLGSITYDPSEWFDLTSAQVGTYSYTYTVGKTKRSAGTSARGTFTLRATDVPVF